MTMPIRHAAGNLLVVGLSGTELTRLERAWLKLVQPTGIILFRRNIDNAMQTRTLLAEAASYCDAANLRCVDIEGGTVDRLRDAVAPMPSAQDVASTRDEKLMRQHGELIAREALAFGFNCTLAPVLDLALPASAAVMGTRAANGEPDGVIAYARAFLAGLTLRGVAGCAKHFPGLGGGTLDSHHETPAIRRTDTELWLEDLAPYRALKAELPMVMVNHAAYPQTPGGDRPASVSPYWISTVLQKRIGYRGLIFSDDMEMGGVLKFMPMEDAAVAAVRAGMHLMEICHSPELILRAFESLIREAERSVAFRKLLLERARTGKRLRKKRFTGVMKKALSAKQMATLRNEVLRFGAAIASSTENRP